MMGTGPILGASPIQGGVPNFTKMRIKPAKLEMAFWKLASVVFLTKASATVRKIQTGPILGVPPYKEGLEISQKFA